jgi:uncharacterized protein YjiS (DUF1127 family)
MQKLHLTADEAQHFQTSQGLAERAARHLGQLWQAYRRWRRIRETELALEVLSDRTLADIGVSRGEIPWIARETASGRYGAGDDLCDAALRR